MHKPFARDTPPHRYKEKVVAGLLALGSARFTHLPGRIQWQRMVKHSPMTVAGAAPGFRLRPGTGFPFNPGQGGTNNEGAVCRPDDRFVNKALYVGQK